MKITNKERKNILLLQDRINKTLIVIEEDQQRGSA